MQFDDLAPDTYRISVKGMDDADTVVFSGSAKATVVAGETVTVMVDLESALGNLTVEFTVPAESTATSFTVEISDSKDFSESKTVSDGTSVQFNDLMPGSYTISVQGMNAGTVVLSGSAKATVVEGQTVTATVPLQDEIGKLSVAFTVPDGSTATSFTVEITGENSITQSETVFDDTPVLFEGLIPGSYSISVVGKNTADDTGASIVVLSGFTTTDVVEGQTVPVTVPLQAVVGRLSVAFTTTAGSTATSYTVKITHLEDKEFSKEETISDGTSVQFNDLIPGSYTISVQGMNAGTVVVSGSATETVIEGQTVTATVSLQDEVGRLSVAFTVPDDSNATSYTVEITHSEDKDFSIEQTISDGTSVQFNDLIPGSYTISVQGMDADTVVLYGTTTSKEVEKGATATATVSLAGIVNTLDELKTAILTGGIIYVGSDISIGATIEETPNQPVTIQAAYKDVTLSWTGTINPMFQPTSGDWTFGGGEHSITLVGGSMSKSIIKISADATPKVTLTTNGVINIKNSSQCGVVISDKETPSNGIFCLDGGSITGSAAHSVEVYANGQFIMKSGSIEASAEKVVYMYDGGTFSMTGGNIYNSSTNANYSSVFLSNGSFTFEGGTISKGVVVGKSDLFTISGTATVDTIKLNTYNVYFTVGGKLDGNSTVATITPNRYQDGEPILKAGSGVDLAVEVGKFKVTPQPNGTQWAIVVAETDAGKVGQLQSVTQ